MYPGMAKTAREEGFDEIADWFETLAKAEKSHAGRFQKALDISSEKVMPDFVSLKESITSFLLFPIQETIPSPVITAFLTIPSHRCT